jgi:hypothetical protein
MEKVLIIHPKDNSTEFLSIIYDHIQNKTVITGDLTKSEVNELIVTHDRVMMMGHGSPYGLFSVGMFSTNNGYIIDNSTVPYLQEKKDNVYIWCHANGFVDKHQLKGFYTGMFISEVGEAMYCSTDDENLGRTTQKEVDESNYGFCGIVKEYITENTDFIYENVFNEYGLIAETNNVAKYNHRRLYKR